MHEDMTPTFEPGSAAPLRFEDMTPTEELGPAEPLRFEDMTPTLEAFELRDAKSVKGSFTGKLRLSRVLATPILQYVCIPT